MNRNSALRGKDTKNIPNQSVQRFGVAFCCSLFFLVQSKPLHAMAATRSPIEFVTIETETKFCGGTARYVAEVTRHTRTTVPRPEAVTCAASEVRMLVCV